MHEVEYIQAWLQGYCKDNEVVLLRANSDGSPPGMYDHLYIEDLAPERFREIDATRPVYHYANDQMRKMFVLDPKEGYGRSRYG